MHKELLFFFVWRDLIIRYKQAALGIVWALIRPLLNMALFVVVFQQIALLKTKAPYPLFVLAGLIPWQFMASNIQSSSMSLIQNTALIQKAGFKRIFLPTSTVLVNLIDCLISLLFFFPCISIFYHFHEQLLFFPLFLALLFLQCLAVSWWCSALSVRFRDLTIAIPYLLQLGVFISPIGFSTELFPEAFRPFFLLNPLIGVIDGFRWSLLGEVNPWMGWTIPYSIGMTLFVLLSGRWFFRKIEHTLADIL